MVVHGRGCRKFKVHPLERFAGDVAAWSFPNIPVQNTLASIPPRPEVPVDPYRFQCPTCNRHYKHKGNLNRHVREECGQDQPIICSKCSKIFKYKRDLYMHFKNECGLSPRQCCKDCGKYFRLESSLLEHMKIECEKIPQFKCPMPFCGFRTKQKKGLQRHVKRPHKGPKEATTPRKKLSDVGRFECPNCDRVYKHERNFSHHVKNDCGRAPHYFCENCKKVYKHRSALYTHTKYECGKEPQFQCPKCPYRAKRKSSLEDHVKLHESGNQPQFQCPNCPYRTRRKSSLRGHLKLHADHPLKEHDVSNGHDPMMKVEVDVCINEDCEKADVMPPLRF